MRRFSKKHLRPDALRLRENSKNWTSDFAWRFRHRQRVVVLAACSVAVMPRVSVPLCGSSQGWREGSY
jgi:hypothetical protein